jgi:sterol desaturase/sphingolipid hydroxylase (fatty acid hydroxylase superfamily)
MVGPALVAVVAAMFVVERWRPGVRRRAATRAHLVDAVYMVLYAAAAPAVVMLNTGFALAVERYAAFLVLPRLTLLPELVVVGLILVGVDAMNWAAHVGNHRSAPLWRFHALHHSQEEMSVFTTFRTHPFTHVSYLPALLPAVVLEASGAVPAAALGVYACLVAVSHANVPWTYGPVGRVLVSPAFHRLHHANTALAGKPAVNFGFVFSIWDQLAGTSVLPSRDLRVATGICGRPVPVEQDAARDSVAALVIAQLAQPFKPRSGLEI